MSVGLLVDVGGSAVKVTAADLNTGRLLTAAHAPLTSHRPDMWTVEGRPDEWMQVIRSTIGSVATAVGRPVAALTVSSLRQGYVLVDGHVELTPLVLNSDRRGRHQIDSLARKVGADRLYDITGHWSAPELTLPKLLHTAAAHPAVWAATTAVLSVHDWLIWRLTGAIAAARSVAGSSQLLDVARGAWATALLEEVGLGTHRFPPLYDAGEVVGTTAIGRSTDVAVTIGGGDTHVAASGVDGDRVGTVVVVAGSSTPLQAALDRPPADPLRHPWIGPHLTPGTWSAETNAGYPGTALQWLARLVGTTPDALAATARQSEPGARGLTGAIGTPAWTEDAWARRPANALVGFDATHDLADAACAVLEGHAHSIRSNLADLERACSTNDQRVVLTGGAARDPWFGQLVASVLGRPVDVPDTTAAAAHAACRLLGGTPTDVACNTFDPQPDARHDEAHSRFLSACRLTEQYTRDIT